MEIDTFYIILAVVLSLVLPLVPQMVRLRIRVLQWLGWNRLAAFHEEGFRRIVLVVRLIMLAIILLLLGIGVRH